MHTKSGSRMAFLQLDDKTARVEVGVFSELYDQRRDVIQKDKVLVVKGKASKDHFSGGIRLSADELFDIEQARGHLARHMRIELQASQLNSEMVNHLKSILAPDEHGQCGIGFEYRSAAGMCKLEAARDWRIVPNAVMMEQLNTILGHDKIRLIY